MRICVIGAGPVGLEAALCAVERGHDVTVLERGAVGASLRRWGPTRFFSPFGMNVSARVKAALGDAAPADDAILTGPEMADRVLARVAQTALAGRVHTDTEVLAVGRARFTRRDRANHPLRFERPFELLVAGPEGERTVVADAVLDCSGVARPCWVGSGGRPAVGERGASARVVRYLGALHERLPALAGRRVLVVGNGHSAACAIDALAGLAAAHPDTRVTWAVRGLNRRPVGAVANDPLPERAGTVNRANDLAADPPPWLTVERRAHVERLIDGPEGVQVGLSGDRNLTCDVICGFTGYRPDHEITGELTVDSSPVSEGTARLYTALSNVTDCLSVPAPRSSDLETGEPGFYWVGTKSYGRMNTFLLRDGVLQVEAIVDGLSEER